METKASYVAVGAFVFALVAGAVVFVIWLARYQGQLEYAYYDILIPGSVTGLQVDGTVRYRGISVGRVANIEIDIPDDLHGTEIFVHAAQLQVGHLLPLRRLRVPLYVAGNAVSGSKPPYA